MKLLLLDCNMGNAFIESIFENYELLSINISLSQFQEMYLEKSPDSITEIFSKLLETNEI